MRVRSARPVGRLAPRLRSKVSDEPVKRRWGARLQSRVGYTTFAMSPSRSTRAPRSADRCRLSPKRAKGLLPPAGTPVGGRTGMLCLRSLPRTLRRMSRLLHPRPSHLPRAPTPQQLSGRQEPSGGSGNPISKRHRRNRSRSDSRSPGAAASDAREGSVWGVGRGPTGTSCFSPLKNYRYF